MNQNLRSEIFMERIEKIRPRCNCEGTPEMTLLEEQTPTHFKFCCWECLNETEVTKKGSRLE